MYPVLSFQIPARPGASQEEIIDTFLEWVSYGKHYDFGEIHREDFLRGDAFCREGRDLTANNATLKLMRCWVEKKYCVAVQLEKMSEEDNLRWQAGCVFEQEEDGVPGNFFFSLDRDIMQAGQPADISVLPKVPVIASKLRKKNLLEDAIYWKERFPLLLVGRICADKQKKWIEELKKRLVMVTRIKVAGEEENDGLPFDGFHCGDDEVRVIYPLAKTERSYAFELLERNGEDAVQQIAWDVFRMVSEVHGCQKISWQKLWEEASRETNGAESGLAEQGSYCYMNQAMADLLRQTRRGRGMSQKELAQEVHTSGLIISRLETTRVQRVLRSLLNDIEQVLGLPENAIASLQGAGDDLSRGFKENTGASEISAMPDGEDERTPKKSGYCRFCGIHLYEDSRYCPKCGRKVLPY